MKPRNRIATLMIVGTLTLLIGCDSGSGVSTSPIINDGSDNQTPTTDPNPTNGTTYLSYNAQFTTTQDTRLSNSELIEEFERNVLFPEHENSSFTGNTQMPDLEMMALNQGFEVQEFDEINPLEHCHILLQTDFGISIYIPDGTQTFTPAGERESRNIVTFDGNRLRGGFSTTHHYADGLFGGNLAHLSMVVMDDSGERIGLTGIYSVVLDEDRVSSFATVPKINIYVQKSYLDYSRGVTDVWRADAQSFPDPRPYSGAVTSIKTYGEC